MVLGRGDDDDVCVCVGDGGVEKEGGWRKKTRRGQHNDEKGFLAGLAFSGCTL